MICALFINWVGIMRRHSSSIVSPVQGLWVRLAYPKNAIYKPWKQGAVATKLLKPEIYDVQGSLL